MTGRGGVQCRWLADNNNKRGHEHGGRRRRQTPGAVRNDSAAARRRPGRVRAQAAAREDTGNQRNVRPDAAAAHPALQGGRARGPRGRPEVGQGRRARGAGDGGG